MNELYDFNDALTEPNFIDVNVHCIIFFEHVNNINYVLRPLGYKLSSKTVLKNNVRVFTI